MKAAAAAAQARDAADLDASQRRLQAAAGVPADELGRGVGAQVALARRDSPHRGAQHLGLAKALVLEMPCTLAALEQGRLSEWRATILVRDTACLSREHRAAVDAEVAGTWTRSSGWATARWGHGPDRSPTASTRARSSSAPGGPSGSGASPSGPRRTPWRT